jgi:hypothetical protein
VFVRNSVTILLQKPLSFVRDVKSVVGDGEGCVAETGLFEHILCPGLCNLRVELLEERCICSRWETRFLIQKRQDTQLALYYINARLIVRKFDELPVNLLLDIFFLFKLEDVCIELYNVSEDARVRYRPSLTSCCSFSFA